MSLVYDALRQSQPDAITASGIPKQPANSWTGVLADHRRPALWLLCGMLVAGPLGFLLSRPADTAPPFPAAIADASSTETDDVVDAARPPVAAPARSVTDAKLALRDPGVADGPAMQAPLTGSPAGQEAATAITATPAAIDNAPADAPVPARLVEAEATPAVVSTASQTPAPAMPAATSGATSHAPPRTDVAVIASQIQVSVRNAESNTGSPKQEDTDTNAVRAAMSQLNAAVGDHDADATASAIANLQSLLPAESLTLLRARAWAAHGSGDLVLAERLYQTIIDRVPDDEHAGVNLALLDARRGEMADARTRLDRMAARNARSPRILQALAELDAATP